MSAAGALAGTEDQIENRKKTCNFLGLYHLGIALSPLCCSRFENKIRNKTCLQVCNKWLVVLYANIHVPTTHNENCEVRTVLFLKGAFLSRGLVVNGFVDFVQVPGPMAVQEWARLVGPTLGQISQAGLCCLVDAMTQHRASLFLTVHGCTKHVVEHTRYQSLGLTLRPSWSTIQV